MAHYGEDEIMQSLINAELKARQGIKVREHEF